ncbi:MAG: c-type cytochrome [Lautropia sp.]
MAAHSQTANHAGAAPRSAGHGDDEGQTSFIKTPKQLITVVVLALILPIIVIVLLASYVVSGKRIGAGADAMTSAAIEARIKPVAGLELRDANAPVAARSGEEIYKAVCGACHAAGVAGAPKFEDKGAWGPRLASGLDALVNAALKGKGAMPAQGGGDYSDTEVTKAVVYMANAAGGNFEAPAAAKAEGGADKPAAGEAPKAAGEAPKADGEAAKANGEAPKANGEAPKASGETPGAGGEAKRP